MGDRLARNNLYQLFSESNELIIKSYISDSFDRLVKKYKVFLK